MTKVLYVGGYGRSGSTLLDVLLGNHPRILGGGELELLFRDLARGGHCSCGAGYRACELWGNVLADLEASIPGFDPTKVAPTLARTESTLGRYRQIGGRAASLDLYGQVWTQVFASAARHARVDLVVDSSKSSRGSSRRLVELARRTDLEIAVVHLIRDPRAVLYSERSRGNNDLIEACGQRSRSVGGAWRPLFGWTMANLAVSVTKARVRTLPILRVHYEDLVSEPEATLERISSLVDVDLTRVAHLLGDGGRIEPGHGVRGNRMRRSGRITLHPDWDWVTESPVLNRVISPLVAPIAVSYGYDGYRWPAPALSSGEDAGDG